MNFLKQVERKLGRFAIPNLTMYLVGGQAAVLLAGMTLPGFLGAIVLMPDSVLAGQWWRLLTFVFTPPFTNPILAIFALYFLYLMGSALEGHWGTFRYNLYVLIGYLMTIAAAFAFPFSVATNVYITGSIFLAFAALFPNYEILLFFVFPVRIKWLALATWLLYGWDFVFGTWPSRLLIIAALSNFFVFFGRSIYYNARYGHRQMRKQATAVVSRDKPRHICAVCGITDKTHRTMDFRYCTKCEPPLAYCTEHLRSHEHVHDGSAAR
jgi:ribosomal protein L37AE/L43A